MKMTVAEISKLLNGEIRGKEDTIITGIAPITEASPEDATFLLNQKYAKHIQDTAAGCIISEWAINTNKTVILVKNVQSAFIRLLELIYEERKERKTGIHPTAVVEAGAVTEEEVYVGPHAVISSGAIIKKGATISAGCFIGSNVKIGAGSYLYPFVTVYENCVLGDRVIIHAGSVIGSDGFGFVKTKEKTNKKIPHIGNVVIGDDVEIGSNTSIDRATMGSTVIGSGTKIDNLVHVAHNVKIGRNCLIAGQTGFAGSTVIGDNVTIAAQCGVADHLTIGNDIIMGARTGVVNNLDSGQVVSGFPARPHMRNMRIMAIIDKLPELYEKIRGKK